VIYQKNIQAGNIIPNDILLRARLMSVVFGLLCCIVLIFIGFYNQNTLGGALAVFLTVTQPLFVNISTKAITDVYCIFFLLCICLFATRLPLQKKTNIFKHSHRYPGRHCDICKNLRLYSIRHVSFYIPTLPD
jgi:dolichyl-phosphate-mannose--protein O-mannosyl transferase